MKKVILLSSVAICCVMPLLFSAPASTIDSRREIEALATVLGPGRHFLAPESLLVTGTDTLTVTVSGSAYFEDHRSFTVVPGEKP